MDNLYLSVCMITYNHSNYISQAVEGVLMQNTSFNYELVIVDDCSTDNNDEVINNLIANHPNGSRIRYIRQQKNLGVKPNFCFALKECLGKYVALCEGDDFWTDPLKLQKQVDFLEENEEYALCFHQTKKLHEDGTEAWYNDFQRNTSFEFVDLIQKQFIYTVSSVFRNPNPLPEWIHDIVGDWSLFLHVSSNGKIYYLRDCMAVYRVHVGGVWTSLSNDEKYRNTIESLDKLDRIFDFKYHAYFEKSKKNRYEIHFPTVSTSIKNSLLTRVKGRLKRILTKSLYKHHL
jgi:glycosyltransferase involved in cell wall biosynthesis